MQGRTPYERSWGRCVIRSHYFGDTERKKWKADALDNLKDDQWRLPGFTWGGKPKNDGVPDSPEVHVRNVAALQAIKRQIRNEELPELS